MLKYVKQADFFEEIITFKINHQQRYKTLFGAVISILLILFTLSMSYILSLDLINKKNPKLNF